MAIRTYIYPVVPTTAAVGGATAANQVLEITALNSIDSKTPTQGQKTMANSSPVVIASDQSAVPVSGPLTDAQLRASAVPISAASLPLPTGAATSANQATEIASLASIDSKLSSPIAVSGPLTDTQLRATPVPVSGTVTANNASVSTTGTAVPASATMVGGSDGTNLRAVKVSATGVISVDGSASTQPVSGSVSILASGTALTQTSNALNVFLQNASVPVRGTGVDGTAVTANTLLISGSDAGTQRNVAVSPTGAVLVNGSAVTQPVSAASLPLPSGAATSANQATEIASLASIDSKLTSPLAVTGPLTDTQLRASVVPVSLTSTTITGSVAVTGPLTDTQLRASAVPISGTVSANQSGSWNIGNITGTITLPTGASTAAKQPALGTAGTASADVITVQGIASMTALKVDGSAVTQPVSVGGTATATLSNVSGSASSVSLLASNAARKGAVFYNDSTASLYLKFGTTASATSFTTLIPPSGYYELPTTVVYTGAIDGIWSAANGAVRITEL